MNVTEQKRPRVAVVGAGGFGVNHLRVFREMDQVELVGVAELDPEKREKAMSTFGCAGFADFRDLAGLVDAAVVATPTTTHAAIGCALLEAGIDVLVEKPIADTLGNAGRLLAAAKGRILQVGHLERFNPAVRALSGIITLPLFFEIHRLNLFSPRSLDVDVVLDLMIHDIEILLSLTGRMPEEIRAAGVAILSKKVDIANVRLAFAGGCIANLTASRVSTERVRKMRLFQPNQYISLDYQRQDGAVFTVSGSKEIGYSALPVIKKEPLRLQAEHFIDCVLTRNAPLVGGQNATQALEVSLAILDKIEEHLEVVAHSLEIHRATSTSLASSPLIPE